jgi:hypothetical protein
MKYAKEKAPKKYANACHAYTYRLTICTTANVTIKKKVS